MARHHLGLDHLGGLATCLAFGALGGSALPHGSSPLLAPALVLALLATVLAGCTQPQAQVVVDFAAHPEQLTGQVVYVDGFPAAELQRDGAEARISIPVDPGQHEIRIAHPRLQVRSAFVNIDSAGQQAFLKAEIVERFRMVDLRWSNGAAA